MQYTFDRDYYIGFSQSYGNLTLALNSAVEMVQDSLTGYFETFGCDNRSVLAKDGAVWVITKTRIHFVRTPEWLETIHSHSYTSQVKKFQTRVESVFTDKDGQTVFYGQLELCPIDMAERCLKKISDISYPTDMECAESLFDTDFDREKPDFEEADLTYSDVVRSADIDMSNHTNNTVYVRYIMNAFHYEQLRDMEISEFFISYGREITLGESFGVYKRQENNRIFLQLRNQDKDISRAIITLRQN